MTVLINVLIFSWIDNLSEKWKLNVPCLKIHTPRNADNGHGDIVDNRRNDFSKKPP